MNDQPAATTWTNPHRVEGTAASRIAESLTRGLALRRKTSAGFALGSFVIECPVPATINALALAGFDFVVLDMEHSPLDFGQLELLITASHAAGLPVLVRPWGDDAGLVGKILDLGANGIMAPHIDSADRARAIVGQCRFAPHGHRGVCPLSRYDALSKPLTMLDESIFVVVQIEGRMAIEKLAEICAVPGIDAIFVGPYDLAVSLGVPPGSAEVFTAARRLAESVSRGPALGIYLDDATTCGEWAARRFALQVVGFDGRMVADAARAIAARARSSVQAGK